MKILKLSALLLNRKKNIEEHSHKKFEQKILSKRLRKNISFLNDINFHSREGKSLKESNNKDFINKKISLKSAKMRSSFIQTYLSYREKKKISNSNSPYQILILKNKELKYHLESNKNYEERKKPKNNLITIRPFSANNINITSDSFIQPKNKLDLKSSLNRYNKNKMKFYFRRTIKIKSKETNSSNQRNTTSQIQNNTFNNINGRTEMNNNKMGNIFILSDSKKNRCNDNKLFSIRRSIKKLKYLKKFRPNCYYNKINLEKYNQQISKISQEELYY